MVSQKFKFMFGKNRQYRRKQGTITTADHYGENVIETSHMNKKRKFNEFLRWFLWCEAQHHDDCAPFLLLTDLISCLSSEFNSNFLRA